MRSRLAADLSRGRSRCDRQGRKDKADRAPLAALCCLFLNASRLPQRLIQWSYNGP